MLITTDKKLIEAFRNQEDLKAVYIILKQDLVIKDSKFECKDINPCYLECNRLGISRGSYLASIIEMVKLLQ